MESLKYTQRKWALPTAPSRIKVLIDKTLIAFYEAVSKVFYTK